MKKSDKSAYEEIFEESLLKFGEIIQMSKITVNDAQRLQEVGYKMLNNFQVVRENRDKWRERCLTAERKLKEHEKPKSPR